MASLLALAAYGLDKNRAKANGRRVPERILLLLSFAGGAPGSLLAMVGMRHKIRFPSFWLTHVLALGLWGRVLFTLPAAA